MLSASETLHVLIEGIKADCAKIRYGYQGRVCVACGSSVWLKYGKHQDKWAVNGRQGCPHCWSGSIAKLDGWFDTDKLAWEWFDGRQAEFEMRKKEQEMKEAA